MHLSRRLTLLAAALAIFTSLAARAASAEADPVGQWPLRPTPDVMASFDSPATPWGAGHRGVDLAGASGQEVRPALPGTVSFVGTIAGRGVVVVDHGDTRTTYEPVGAMVTRGQRVGDRDVLGVLGIPGSHCFPRACLHWGWIRGDTYLDPLRLVGAAPVRLLPLSGLPAPAAGPARSPYVTWRPIADVLARAVTWW
ncbi:MAG: M23 family metallopeptidase [Nocardioides sp.]